MAQEANAQWRELERQILDQLDIKAEYEQLGIEFVSSQPTARGYLSCRSADGRDDRNPSAGICISSGKQRGRYKDHGADGESLSFFRFCEHYGRWATWRDARAHFAEQVGIKLPRSKETASIDHIQIGEGKSDILWYSRTKPGVNVNALILAGMKPGFWPKWAKEPNPVVAAPGYSYRGLDDDVAAYHIAGNKNQLIKSHPKGKEPNYRKTRQLGPGGSIFNRHAVANWDKAEVVWLVEGLSDMLALQSALGDRTDHICCTVGGANTSLGPGWPERFAGKTVHICYDNDTPDKKGKRAGQEGSIARAGQVSEHAAVTRIVKLPVEGTDLRNFLCECGYDDLYELAEQSEPIKAKGASGVAAEMLPDGMFANGFLVGEGKEASVVSIQIEDVYKRMIAATGGWPKRLGRNLFYEVSQGNIAFLDKAPDLFAYIHSQFGANFQWHNNSPSVATKSEFFSYCVHHAEECESVEIYPHFPKFKGFYYSIPMDLTPPTDGQRLSEFLNFFNPATDVDADLIKAAAMTLFWGGQPGSRPAFLFTGNGRGIGKSETAMALSSLTGGYFQVSKDESIERVKGRLLTTEAMEKRVGLIDNIKAYKFSSADFESLITSSRISGHQLYKGEHSRPNMLTWFLTMNSPNLSKDIAQRAVPITLVRPQQYSGRWKREVADFIENHRWEIIADIKQAFDEEPQSIKATRWGEWEEEVLARVGIASDSVAVIKERQDEFDSDESESSDFKQFIIEQLASFGYNFDAERLHIRTERLFEWYQDWSGDKRLNKITFGRQMGQKFKEGTTTWLMPNPSRTYGRGYIFQLTDSPSKLNVWYDLEDRIGLSGGSGNQRGGTF